MRRTTTFGWAVLVTAAVATLAGCGGGAGGGGGGSPGFATLKGAVTEVDGQTANLGGVLLSLDPAGATVVTGADGSFSFGTVPAGALTLRLAGGTFLQKDGADDGADHDAGDDDGGDLPDGQSDDPSGDDDDDDDGDDDGRDVDDGDDATEDRVEIRRVEDGERIEVHLRLRDGKIEGMECSRSGDDEREAEARLTRSATNDDADMTGKVEAESRTDRERLQVEVEHATPGRTLEAFVVDASGNEESIGVRTVEADGEAEWEIKTSDGGRLPFDAATVADLEGFVVLVRDATSGDELLRGEVPEVPTSVGSDDDGSDDDGGSGDDDDDDDDARERGRGLLTANVAGLEGYVELRRREEDGGLRQRFQVEAEHLEVGQVVEIWLEDPANPGTLVRIATVAADAEGEAELELDTEDGDALPFGVASVEDLIGLAVEVRSAADGAVLLSGVVPSLISE